MGGEPFALDRRTRRRLIDRLLAAGGGGRFRAHLAEAGEDAALLSLQLTADVFLDAFGNTAEVLRAEYEPLLSSVTHVLILDAEQRSVVGSVILQEAPAQQLKTVVDVTAPPWSMRPEDVYTELELPPGARTAADLLLLSVRSSHRGLGLSPALIYTGWMATSRHGLDRWTAILDAPLLRGVIALTGGELRAFAPARPYLGSAASTPITVRLDPARDGVLLQRIQALGRAVERKVDLCPRLAAVHRTFQALPPVPERVRERERPEPIVGPERLLTTERLARRRTPIA